MTVDDDDSISPVLAFLIVLWPAVLCAAGYLIVLLAEWQGCTIRARGPEECMVFGFDIGWLLHPLWGLGIYLVYAVFWVPVGLIILGLVRRLVKG